MTTASRSNLHLFLTPVVSQSRLFKEAGYLIENKIFDEVSVLGIWDNGLPFEEIHESGLRIHRFYSLLRKLRARGFFQETGLFRKMLTVYALFEYMMAALRFTRKYKPTHLSVHNLILLPISVIIAKLYRVKIIYVPHELETERTGLKGFEKILSKIIERLLIKYCAELVVVCEPIAEWYRTHYEFNEVRVVRNVPRRMDVTILKAAERDLKTIFKVPEDSLLYIYQGLIEKSRGAGDLINAFQASHQSLVFMGYGEYESVIRNLPNQNIHFQTAVPIDQIVSFTSSADVGIFVVNGSLSLSYTLCLPNKFFEYLHAGIPVIVGKNLTYLAQLVKKYRLGWVIDFDRLGDAVASITREEIEAYKSNVRAFAADCVWEVDAEAYSIVYK